MIAAPEYFWQHTFLLDVLVKPKGYQPLINGLRAHNVRQITHLLVTAAPDYLWQHTLSARRASQIP